ncbi:hypothetical protein BRE01_53230 [Brevibacillus reuszeri]|uniref:Uncharacterized protein n=1 Tax=Brevibacillus reuszeri TaxID=54915 RepID=A0A0K9YKP1_9BACL|nr:hypothetical protein [Brevibacillus reuszeri]KNB69241.1 hypothetical protein ADS79_25340 [Brevibacillus reuszeri]MED1860182.1 hypothetical protein [Brevibacillus reuszeri]GED71621.1 hypothetical protein BRE01_53230 [Brevibacillus reuszeri]
MKWKEKIQTVLLAGILLCLFFIANKPAASLNAPPINMPSFPTIPVSSNSSVTQIDKNRFAIVEKRDDVETRVVILEYDESTKQVTEVNKTSFNFDLNFITK